MRNSLAYMCKHHSQLCVSFLLVLKQAINVACSHSRTSSHLILLSLWTPIVTSYQAEKSILELTTWQCTQLGEPQVGPQVLAFYFASLFQLQTVLTDYHDLKAAFQFVSIAKLLQYVSAATLDNVNSSFKSFSRRAHLQQKSEAIRCLFRFLMA